MSEQKPPPKTPPTDTTNPGPPREPGKGKDHKANYTPPKQGVVYGPVIPIMPEPADGPPAPKGERGGK